MALSIVGRPTDATTTPSIDIVAVHGLGGDAITTWTHPKSNAFWLKDFLPQQIPDARIMTFGYNAKAAFGQSTAEGINRPLMLIAHSLGGIVVKQALLQARLEPQYHSIRDSTFGLIFLGTPHRGSDKATYGKVLANIAQFATYRPPPHLLTTLQTNSDVLLRFYEQFPMKGFSSLTVEKHSALLETNHEEQMSVDADHSMICKFETDSDDTFKKIYKRVQRMRNSPQPRADEPSELYNKHFEVPHLLSPVFTEHDGTTCPLQLVTLRDRRRTRDRLEQTERDRHNTKLREMDGTILELTEKALQKRRSSLGEDHPGTFKLMHELAMRYSEAGRRTEALQLTERVLQLRKSKLGDDHPDTLMSDRLLAHLSEGIFSKSIGSEASDQRRHSKIHIPTMTSFGK
ncbi:Kinesin light chain 3 [Puttea exsequens]|nr:Kinesin light chain 3 [Puttea exsequens]